MSANSPTMQRQSASHLLSRFTAVSVFTRKMWIYSILTDARTGSEKFLGADPYGASTCAPAGRKRQKLVRLVISR